ncbi:hypothetical protein G6705_08585, partial [Polynucleobacter paneuropaeus]|nr:hypothetical protein [Polynucleobacter paneuropaeus]
TVTLSKAALGINLNATYNGTTSYSTGIQTNGLVGTADTTYGVASVTINTANVADAVNYIKTVTGATGANDTSLLNNYTISSSKSGIAVITAPTTKTDNTVTLSKAALGVAVAGTYNGTLAYVDGTGNAVVTLAGLVNNQTAGTVTANINTANVGDNGSNYVSSVSTIGGTFNPNNYA